MSRLHCAAILCVLFAVDYMGIGERYPLRLVGDYVHNSGADDHVAVAGRTYQNRLRLNAMVTF